MTPPEPDERLAAKSAASREMAARAEAVGESERLVSDEVLDEASSAREVRPAPELARLPWSHLRTPKRWTERPSSIR